MSVAASDSSDECGSLRGHLMSVAASDSSDECGSLRVI